jgi:hypothetical protein
MAPLHAALIMSVVVGCLATPSGASAQAASGDLESIRESVLYARYREAQEALEAYLARDDLDARGLNDGLELLATILIARRQTREAQDVLQRLYARDPGHRLSDPDASPPVLSAFGRARENPPAPAEVVLDHQPSDRASRSAGSIEVSISGEGASAVQEVRLHYRHAGEPSFTTVVMPIAEGVARSRLPIVEESTAYDVEYHIEASAPSGSILQSIGSANEPLVIHVPASRRAEVEVESTEFTGDVDEDEGGSLAWLWITLGVLAVGGGVTVAVLLLTDSGPDDGSLGNITLPLVSF